MPSNHLILCCPLLYLPSIIPSINIRQWLSLLLSQPENQWVGSRALISWKAKSSLLSLPRPLLCSHSFSRNESLSATAHKTWHQRPALLTGSWPPPFKKRNKTKRLSRTRVKEQPRRGHWSLSPGLSGFGTGRGQGFPDVPLKGWTGARGALQIYKETPVPQVCTMQNPKLSEESHCPSGQGLPRAFWLFLLSSLTPRPWPPPSSGSPPLPRHTLPQPSQAHTFPLNYQLWFP